MKSNPTAILIAALALIAIGASSQMFTNSPYSKQTRWSLVYSNSNDGWNGPVAVSEISDFEGRILRTISMNYQPFNTNAVMPITNSVIIGNLTVTNSLRINTNAINRLMEDGTICFVRGNHDWQSGCGVFGCLVIHGDTPMRHCLICKKTETRDLGPWK